MASNFHEEWGTNESRNGEERDSDQLSFSCSDSEDQSDFDYDTGAVGRHTSPRTEPCRYYNGKGCRDGNSCHYLHVCKFYWRGSCRNDNACRLRHIIDSDSDETGGRWNFRGRRGSANGAGRKRRSQRRSPSSGGELNDGPYRWQLDSGSGWQDIANDHILEAQYSRPCTKGINLFNTPHGIISIDFQKMRVLKKRSLHVRRLGSRQTTWLWYFKGDDQWNQYGEKDSKGHSSPMKSSVLETEFQKDKSGSYRFRVGFNNYEIDFKDMHQKNLSTGNQRKVRRRPLYKSPQNSGRLVQAMGALNLVSPSNSGKWQFGGSRNQWYDFKYQCGSYAECSVSSADIEAKYQQNPRGRMSFTVNGQSYDLNFATMTQTNLLTGTVRKVRRV